MDENKKLKEELEALKRENQELKQSNELLGKDIAERDNAIAELKKNAQDRAFQFKKLKDMTEAERELLSEKEKELMARQEALEEERERDRQERAERDSKERNYRIDSIAKRLSKGNEEIAKQIRVNFEKLNPELTAKAITEDELVPFIQDAFRMTAIDSTPDPLNQAHNYGGSSADVPKQDFATTPQAQELGKAMGLSSFQENNTNNNK